MDFKPTIFIGSSSEGFDIAKKIQELLDDTAECRLWKGAFDYGKSNYDNLTSKISFYDYAILIATADDITISRKKSTSSPRDNVVFEFGLFAGGLGKSKVFYIIEEGTKILTDLSGITQPFIPSKKSSNFDDALRTSASEIKQYILNKEKTYELGFLPSTALAYGYFINFVERTVERLLEDKSEKKVFHLENSVGFEIKELKFTIAIPNDLSNDMYKKVKAKRLRDGWRKLKVDPKDVRDYDFSVDISQATKGTMHLVDIPFTLNALNKAIELYSRKENIGKDEKETILEYREIRNFKRTLEYLIYNSSITRGIVSIEIVDI